MPNTFACLLLQPGKTPLSALIDVPRARHFLAGVAFFAVALYSTPGRAHQDPPDCLGVDYSLSLFLAQHDGSPLVGPITECQTIRVVSTLEWEAECLIQGGTFAVTTPDGTQHIVPDPVPCLGSATVNAEGCTIGQDVEIISVLEYTVNLEDTVEGVLTFSASWQGGVFHGAAGNVPEIGSTRALQAAVELCGDGSFCNGSEFCDPAATDGVRLGLCQPGTPECGTSDQCADRGCDEELDKCFEIDTAGRCGTSDFCVERSCNPEIGCLEDDQSDIICPDEFCTERTCNPAGGCIDTDVSGKCGTSDQCTERTCDEETDTCVEVGMCECEEGACDDENPCTQDHCEPAMGCQFMALPEGEACDFEVECTGGPATCSSESRCEVPPGCAGIEVPPVIDAVTHELEISVNFVSDGSFTGKAKVVFSKDSGRLAQDAGFESEARAAAVPTAAIKASKCRRGARVVQRKPRLVDGSLKGPQAKLVARLTKRGEKCREQFGPLLVDLNLPVKQKRRGGRKETTATFRGQRLWR